MRGTEATSVSLASQRAALIHHALPRLSDVAIAFSIIKCLLEIDEQLSSWRYRHMNMVHRMIGTRIGTGGSTGKDYLKAAADKHYIFGNCTAQ